MTKYKQVIIIRKDLKMGKGKLVAHCIHAAIGSLRASDENTVKLWEDEGAKKIVLKVNDLKELMSIKKKVNDAKIPHHLVKDAGLTQLKPGTVTALGIGPYDEKKIDKVTGKLKLL